MQQLSEHDAAFLAGDNTHANANVSLLHIYDQSTAPQGKVRFKTILAHIESRLGASPVFRRRLLRAPLGLDRPYWVDDEDFDLEYHVRHIALPKPGDWRQFCIQVSRIHARPLDLNRPLWELYVIEGLDSFLDLPEGSFALMTKTHHAALDFEHDVELTTLLHDDSPSAGVSPPPAPWFPDAPPGGLPLLARGLWRTFSSPRRSALPLARRLLRMAPSQVALAGDMLLRAGTMPLVRFNAVVSPHRVFETRRFGDDEFGRIRRLVRGATVHDAVLAVCGGALRRYLDGHDELPAPSLVALAPLPMADGEVPTASGAELHWMRVSLGTDLEDPVQRLRHVHAQCAAVGAGHAGAATAGPAQPGAAAADAEDGSGTRFGRTAKQVARKLLAERTPLANCSLTQVPGPRRPMYLCGARLTYFSAMLPIHDGMGLAFAVTSYDGRVVISPTSCRELMPDPERFAQCLRDSFQELLAIADTRRPLRRTAGAAGAKSAAREPGPRPVKPPRPGRTSRPSPRA